MRKMFVTLTLRLEIDAEEDANLSDIIDEMDYNFISNTPNADIVDMSIDDYEVIDSK